MIGDGCMTSLEFPDRQLEFLEMVRNDMRSNGRLIMRFFVQKEEPERPEEVFRDLIEDRIGSFHAFKWRLAM